MNLHRDRRPTRGGRMPTARIGKLTSRSPRWRTNWPRGFAGPWAFEFARNVHQKELAHFGEPHFAPWTEVGDARISSWTPVVRENDDNGWGQRARPGVLVPGAGCGADAPRCGRSVRTAASGAAGQGGGGARGAGTADFATAAAGPPLLAASRPRALGRARPFPCPGPRPHPPAAVTGRSRRTRRARRRAGRPATGPEPAAVGVARDHWSGRRPVRGPGEAAPRLGRRLQSDRSRSRAAGRLHPRLGTATDHRLTRGYLARRCLAYRWKPLPTAPTARRRAVRRP